MRNHIRLSRFLVMALALSMSTLVQAQTTNCVSKTGKQLVIYRAGSLTRAFTPLEAMFTCQTGVEVKDFPMGSVDAGRQITAGGQAADLYAPADYLDIDLLMKPAGYASFNIVFARGRMVLAYSANGLAAKKLPSVAEPGPFNPPNNIPKAAAKWYETLTMPNVAISGGHPFLDPGAYRGPMMFQLAEEFYKAPNLYNNLLKRMIIPGANSGATLGKEFDFQFTYEHTAQATAATNPDYRYVRLPEEIDMSDPAKDVYYRQNAVVVIPGLGTPKSAKTVAIPGAHVAWGITLMNNAPNKDTAVKFLQLLLSPAGTALMNQYGPAPISPALVNAADLGKLPSSLRSLVKTNGK
ncbi:MAG: substrate-binding domain-containing protein [Acidobacteriota bacterium]